WLK
ncbi:alpha-amylase domain protein, partial [Vibrio parahaemolyticus V-223/04]